MKFHFSPHEDMLFHSAQRRLPRCWADLNLFTYLNRVMSREEQGIPSCVLNSTLIGIYKGSVLRFMRFIHLDLFVLSLFSQFKHTPCFSRKSLCMSSLFPATWKREAGQENVWMCFTIISVSGKKCLSFCPLEVYSTAVTQQTVQHQLFHVLILALPTNRSAAFNIQVSQF